MRIGFTGTQDGMTPQQQAVVDMHLQEQFEYNSVFRHGDCIGADAEAHDIARCDGYAIIIHPPSNSSKQAHKSGDVINSPKPYLERNRDIVDNCDILIAAPKTLLETVRSGTWSTVRYARKLGKRIIIVYPNGTWNDTPPATIGRTGRPQNRHNRGAE